MRIFSRWLMIILFFTFLQHVTAQHVKVHTTQPVYDVRALNNKILAPLFKYQSDTLQSFKGFGTRSKKIPPRFTIQLPNMSGCLDTAYTYVYFGGNPNAAHEGFTPVIVGNYKRGYRAALLWPDRNFNNNFSDDGPPDTFSINHPFVRITQQWPANNGPTLSTRLTRLPFTVTNERFKRLTDEFYNRYSPPAVFLGTYHSFVFFRETMFGNDVKLGVDSFRIVLHDANANGRFDDAETDHIICLPWGTDTINNNGFTTTIAGKGPTYIEWNLRSYKMKEIDAFGKSITFFDESEQAATLAPGRKIPKFKFQLAGGEWKKIKKYRRRPVYLYFWSRSQESFDHDTAWLRKIQEDYGKKVNLVTLNYRDNPTMTESMVEFSKPVFIVGFSSAHINRNLRVEQLPTGYYLRKRLRFQEKINDPEAFYYWLKEAETNKKSR